MDSPPFYELGTLMKPHPLRRMYFLISLSPCVLVAALWIRSYFRTDWRYVEGFGGSLTFHPNAGEIETFIHSPADPRIAIAFRDDGDARLDGPNSAAQQPYHAAGFGLNPTQYFPRTPNRAAGYRTVIVLPYYFITFLTLTVPAVSMLNRWRSQRIISRRRRLELCCQCGYDLRGCSGSCPECGFIG